MLEVDKDSSTNTSSQAVFDRGLKRKHKTHVDTKTQTSLISLAKEKRCYMFEHMYLCKESLHLSHSFGKLLLCMLGSLQGIISCRYSAVAV